MEHVGHAQWVFTIPKMLRIYFLHHRELLGALSLAAYETVKELTVAAVEEKGFRPGVVSVVQTFGDGARFHPHVHALVSRGGWTASGEWIPLPYVDEVAAEKLFDSPRVSRRHARIVVRADTATIEDLGSKNGTTVGSERVVGETELVDGDEIRIGPAELLFLASGEGSTETESRGLHGRSARTDE